MNSDKKKVLEYKEYHNNYDHLKHKLKPQWGWRTYISIAALIGIYALIFIDLEINLRDLLTNSGKYIFDVVSRMLPPDFSNFSELALSMLETVEIAMLGTLLAI